MHLSSIHPYHPFMCKHFAWVLWNKVVIFGALVALLVLRLLESSAMRSERCIGSRWAPGRSHEDGFAEHQICVGVWWFWLCLMILLMSVSMMIFDFQCAFFCAWTKETPSFVHARYSVKFLQEQMGRLEHPDGLTTRSDGFRFEEHSTSKVLGD